MLDQDRFRTFATRVSEKLGSHRAFLLATGVVIAWLVSGPIFHISNGWQLVINTGTTIVTFLMVFLIQATQNRDAEALQVKLDEIIRCIDGARNDLLDLEELEDEDLMRIHQNYLDLAEKARKRLKKEGKPDTSVPDLNI